jgi:hypothetical protein
MTLENFDRVKNRVNLTGEHLEISQVDLDGEVNANNAYDPFNFRST